MKQATTTIAKGTVTRWVIAALLLALATTLVAYPTSPALAQEEGVQEGPQPPPVDQVTLSFELTVRGEVPEGTRFFGSAVGEGGPGVPLTDPDGDGTFTGSVTVPSFPPGPRPVPPGTEPISLSVQIVQESGGNIEVIRDFGLVPLDGDKTFSARVNFRRDGGGSEPPEDTVPGTPGSGGSEDGGGSGDAPDLTAPENGVDLNQDGSTDEADGQVAAATSDAAMEAHQASGGQALPATGGIALLQIAGGAGVLLVAGGSLIRRLAR